MIHFSSIILRFLVSTRFTVESIGLISIRLIECSSDCNRFLTLQKYPCVISKSNGRFYSYLHVFYYSTINCLYLMNHLFFIVVFLIVSPFSPCSVVIRTLFKGLPQQKLHIKYFQGRGDNLLAPLSFN